jgi:2-dehydro-3-deoxygalactonokinase
MRGEETEILGLFANGQYADVAENGLVILPGTHSKHVRLRKRQITDFTTYMTGELFEVLAGHSILRASVGEQGEASSSLLNDPAARAGFIEGIQAASKQGLVRNLFQTRTRTVLHSVRAAANRWYLSGLLIGAEIADLVVRERNVPLLLAAPAPLNEAYGLVFETLGLMGRTQLVPPTEMALASVHGHFMLLNEDIRGTICSPL